MTRSQRRGAEEARNQLPALLSDAERGRSTIISRRGRAIAALVPIERVAAMSQRSLLPLAGSGRGLWSGNDAASVGVQRDEWS